MKLPLLIILFVSVAPLYPSRLCVAADAPQMVPVASYLNTPEMNETVGNRAHAILRAKKIESVAVGSAGMTISVPADRAAEALRLLAQVIKAEKLQLTLLVHQGDRDVIVTPDSVLEPKKAQ